MEGFAAVEEGSLTSAEDAAADKGTDEPAEVADAVAADAAAGDVAGAAAEVLDDEGSDVAAAEVAAVAVAVGV